ncbi:hypothetical protein swp_4768 [Shewanella piezotolerans WP3]|uniref:Uncharacterized protein n=1 Tax=Shewanella piezotolerans (strain WP3 / JCM 13877) TaxID=225849 RepID=B8CUS4_SHEPW|nr:hypothetical protein swp_4768 [Shewanella piezotolerans WP3]
MAGSNSYEKLAAATRSIQPTTYYYPMSHYHTDDQQK